MRKKLMNRHFVLAVALWALMLGLCPSQGWALPSESLALVQSASARETEINKIMSVLEKPEARLHLRLMGIHDGEIRDALLKLDDDALAEVGGKADTIRAGGDGLGIVVTILVIVLLVVLILSLTNKKIEVKDDKK